MLIDNVNIKEFKAELLDRAISTTVVHSITDWLDEATEGTLLRQSYDWRNIRLTFLIREVSEDGAYKRISALTEALKNCTIRFDDIDLDFPCVLDGSTVPDRLQNGVFKLVVLLKNDWAIGDLHTETFDIDDDEAKHITVKFVRNWADTMGYAVNCFTQEEIFEELANEGFYIDLAQIPTIAESVTSWEEFFLSLGVDVNKYKSANEQNGFLDITDEYSVENAVEVFNEKDEFTVYYNRMQMDGYPDLPGPKTYPSIVWQAKSNNTYYFETDVGAGWDINDISVDITGRYYSVDASENGPMFGTKDREKFGMAVNSTYADWFIGQDNARSQKVYDTDSAMGKQILIETLEDVSDVPLRAHGIKSSNEGSAPIDGFADLVFNGSTKTREATKNFTLTSNITIAWGYTTNDKQNVGRNLEVARVRIYYKGELIRDYIPIASSLKNGFFNDYDIGLYDTKTMTFCGWSNTNGTSSRKPDGDIMPIPASPDTPKPPSDVKTYHVTVVNGTGSGDYELGALVTIQANDPDNNDLIFDKWTLEGDTTLEDDETVDPNSFYMPDSDVTVTASYKDKPIEVEPGWLLYSSPSSKGPNAETKMGEFADNNWESGLAALYGEGIIVFSVPGASVTDISYYSSANFTLSTPDFGARDQWNRLCIYIKIKSSTSKYGQSIKGIYEGQEYEQEFRISSLW